VQICRHLCSLNWPIRPTRVARLNDLQSSIAQGGTSLTGREIGLNVSLPPDRVAVGGRAGDGGSGMYKLNRSEKAAKRARVERRGSGATERLLWGQLEHDKLGVRFRRQYAVGKYILDLYCAKARLCIEVDGPHHLARTEKDRAQDDYLAQRES